MHEPEFDGDQERPGFTYRRARLARQAGGEHLGASMYEIPPGEASFPYHAHVANEELMLVFAGRPSVRTPSGWRELAPGDVVAFPAGEEGAHQVVNRSAAPARVLVVSTMIAPEIAFYPDSGKLMATTRPPGAAAEGLMELFLRSQAVGYWEGEEPPREAG